MQKLTITSGQRKGKEFDGLEDYLADQYRRQKRCKHSRVRFTYMVSGINSDTQHLTAAIVCRFCHLTVDSVRVKIDYEEAKRLYPGKKDDDENSLPLE